MAPSSGRAREVSEEDCLDPKEPAMAAEFEIKIAKAKDLPLSWFDLVLRPEKFKQHIKTLENNPNSKSSTGHNIDAVYGIENSIFNSNTLFWRLCERLLINCMFTAHS